MVGVLAVGEYVDEKFTIGVEPVGNAFEQELIVLHVLEHFHGHDAVEAGFARALEADHVCGDDIDVVEVSFFRLGHDVLALGAGVGDGGDFRQGEMFRHPQRERSPAAAELENFLPVL